MIYTGTYSSPTRPARASASGCCRNRCSPPSGASRATTISARRACSATCPRAGHQAIDGTSPVRNNYAPQGARNAAGHGGTFSAGLKLAALAATLFLGVAAAWPCHRREIGSVSGRAEKRRALRSRRTAMPTIRHAQTSTMKCASASGSARAKNIRKGIARLGGVLSNLSGRKFKGEISLGRTLRAKVGEIFGERAPSRAPVRRRAEPAFNFFHGSVQGQSGFRRDAENRDAGCVRSPDFSSGRISNGFLSRRFISAVSSRLAILHSVSRRMSNEDAQELRTSFGSAGLVVGFRGRQWRRRGKMDLLMQHFQRFEMSFYVPGGRARACSGSLQDPIPLPACRQSRSHFFPELWPLVRFIFFHVSRKDGSFVAFRAFALVDHQERLANAALASAVNGPDLRVIGD